MNLILNVYFFFMFTSSPAHASLRLRGRARMQLPWAPNLNRKEEDNLGCPSKYRCCRCQRPCLTPPLKHCHTPARAPGSLDVLAAERHEVSPPARVEDHGAVVRAGQPALRHTKTRHRAQLSQGIRAGNTFKTKSSSSVEPCAREVRLTCSPVYPAPPGVISSERENETPLSSDASIVRLRRPVSE